MSSAAALIVGVLLAILVVAFCGDGDEGTEGPTARATPGVTRTGTVARTPETRTPVTTRTPRATGTPRGTPSAPTPAAGTQTPSDDGAPPEETPGVIPPGETPGGPPPAPTATLAPGETPPVPTPTRRAATATPVAPTSTPLPTATPTPPPELPDLVLRDMWVFRDRIVVVVGNEGEGDLLPGQTLEIGVRGVVAETLVVSDPVGRGESLNVLLQNQPVYGREMILGRVDPNNLIAEEDDNNNGFAAVLTPDVPLDLAVVGLVAVGSEQHLGVRIRNETTAPALGADVRLSVYREGGEDIAAVARQTLDVEPLQTVQVDVLTQVAVRGVSFRVVMEIFNRPDANPANNTLEATVP